MGLKFNLDNRSPGIINYQDHEIAYFCIPEENNGGVYAYVLGIRDDNHWMSLHEMFVKNQNNNVDIDLGMILEKICKDKNLNHLIYPDIFLKQFKLDEETKSLLKKVFDEKPEWY